MRNTPMVAVPRPSKRLFQSADRTASERTIAIRTAANAAAAIVPTAYSAVVRPASWRPSVLTCCQRPRNHPRT